MTRDDIIRMAREAGLLILSFRMGGGLALGTCTVPDFERFAVLGASALRVQHQVGHSQRLRALLPQAGQNARASLGMPGSPLRP